MNNQLSNLAGRMDCDRIIVQELERAKIQIERNPRRSRAEVASSIRGTMSGGLIFTRGWTYWVVRGLVPLEIAAALYADPVGKTDIRVTGHCACPAPTDPWVSYLDDKGNKVLSEIEKASFELLKVDPPDYVRFAPEPKLFKPFIESYHIDSEVGLRIFADAIRGYSFHQMSRFSEFSEKVVHRKNEKKVDQVLHEYRTPVKTVGPRTQDREWSEEALASRRWGIMGEVRHHTDSHGLCYQVWHQDNNSMGWYAPQEIEVLAEAKVEG